MKYKEGDKVRIKTWDDMVKEFTPRNDGCISIHKHSNYTKSMDIIIEDLDTDRVVTILKVVEDVDLAKNEIPYYKIEETYERWVWTDEMIECIAVPSEPIDNRFEILDL